MRLVNNSFERHLLNSTVKLNRKIEQLSSFVNKISQRIVTAINSANEVRVWQSSDREGHTIWHGYNPTTGGSISVDSETEIRCWIEEQYYQY